MLLATVRACRGTNFNLKEFNDYKKDPSLDIFGEKIKLIRKKESHKYGPRNFTNLGILKELIFGKTTSPPFKVRDQLSTAITQTMGHLKLRKASSFAINPTTGANQPMFWNLGH